MKTKYGYMACPDCSQRVTVKANANNTLSFTCDECDAAGYCKAGAGNRAAWEKKITKITPAEPPAPKPGEKKPEGEKKSGGMWE